MEILDIDQISKKLYLLSHNCCTFLKTYRSNSKEVKSNKDNTLVGNNYIIKITRTKVVHKNVSHECYKVKLHSDQIFTSLL